MKSLTEDLPDLPPEVVPAVTKAIAVEDSVSSEIPMDDYRQHVTHGCRVMLYRVFDDWEIDIVLPNGAGFGFDVPVGTIKGKRKDGSDWTF